MGQLICHHKGRYNIYTTVSDGFYWEPSISLEDLEKYTKDQYGAVGLHELPQRLKRAKEKGVSSHIDKDLSAAIGLNHAGKDGKRLTYNECIERFLS